MVGWKCKVSCSLVAIGEVGVRVPKYLWRWVMNQGQGLKFLYLVAVITVPVYLGHSIINGRMMLYSFLSKTVSIYCWIDRKSFPVASWPNLDSNLCSSAPYPTIYNHLTMAPL